MTEMISTKRSFELDNHSQFPMVLCSNRLDSPQICVSVVLSGTHLNRTMLTNLLMKTKHICTGYWGSVTKIFAQIKEILESSPPDKVKLLLLKVTLD